MEGYVRHCEPAMPSTNHPQDPASAVAPHPFAVLSPDFILTAVESLGLVCDGRTFALNSYENRVFQVGMEDQEPLIVKFYRPGRWSREQILEEHAFGLELAAAECPVVVPLALADGTTLHEWQGFLFCLYPRKGGHAPELERPDILLMLGRLLGRMHAVGATRSFATRPALTVADYGRDSAVFLLEHRIPSSLRRAYETLALDLVKRLEGILDERYRLAGIRVHGDLHGGNMLWRDDYFHFVDLDDCRTAPAVQDLWMLLSGERQERQWQLQELLEGYDEFFTFDPLQLRWVEALRTLRMMHYAAWLGRRIDDPAFIRAFPWFNTERYWGQHLLELREQLALLDEPPLSLMP